MISKKRLHRLNIALSSINLAYMSVLAYLRHLGVEKYRISDHIIFALSLGLMFWLILAYRSRKEAIK